MSSWFYNNVYSTTKYTENKNKIGQVIKIYSLDRDYPCDIQPIDEKAYKYTWGYDIKSNIQMFCDESLNIDDVISYNNIPYKIEKKIPWDEYYVYALLESDMKLND